MKFAAILIGVFVVCVAAQAPPAAVQAPPAPGTPAPSATQFPPETVIATIDGKQFTYAEFQRYMRGMPPQVQQNATRNPKQFLQQLGLMQKLSELAEKAKLDQGSPYKEAIEFNRMNILMQAQINATYNSFPISPDDERKYYDQNKSKYQQVKLKVIYITFTNAASPPADGKKRLSEEEAKAKAEHLAKDARGGADFAKLVEENSEDATSKAKGGDFGVISRSDNLPESIRSVIFALKENEVSDPVRQPNGFYVFRAEAITEKPFAEIREQIFGELKNARLKDWLDTTTKSLNIKFENEQFFSSPILPGLGTPLPNK